MKGWRKTVDNDCYYYQATSRYTQMQLIVTDEVVRSVSRSVGLSVCQSLCLNHEPCKNGWTDQDVVWDVHLGRTNEPCIRRRRSRSPGDGGNFEGRKNWCKKKHAVKQLTTDVTRQTWSIISCSVADASQRLLRMKMFGFDSRSLTRWKKFFSCAKHTARHRLSTYACKQSTIIAVIIIAHDIRRMYKTSP